MAPLRAIDIHHTTVLHWITEVGHKVKNASESEKIPEITDFDELQTNA